MTRALDKFLYCDEPIHHANPPDDAEKKIIFDAYREDGANAAIAALIDAGYEGRSLTYIRDLCSRNGVRGPRPGRRWRLPEKGNRHKGIEAQSRTSSVPSFCLLPLCLLPLCVTPSPARAADLSRLLSAIRDVETGSHHDPANARGDGGLSLGPYQIQRAYWTDSRTPGCYHQVRSRPCAERVIVNYWKRYCSRALARGSACALARVHNGGPAGHRNPRTLAYWNKVRRAMR